LDLIQDPIVQYNIDYKAKFYQAYLVKQYLSEQPVGDITEEEQRAAFKGMGMNSANSRSFSGWVITADNFAEAQQIKAEIMNDEALPDSFQRFESYKNKDPRVIFALQNQVFRAPLNAPVVVTTKDSFYVLLISERSLNRRTFEEAQDEVLDRMSNYYNIVEELKDLHAKAKISVDTTAFESLMKHFDNPALRGQGN
jgi:hypothetical protein